MAGRLESDSKLAGYGFTNGVPRFLVQQGEGQVYFDTNHLTRESFGEAGFAVSEQYLVLRNQG